MVSGFHSKLNPVNIYLPKNKENDFRQSMTFSPLVPVDIKIHGMDGKMIGYYKKNRTDNIGGRTL